MTLPPPPPAAGTLADLAAAGYPAVALDLRGHGESALGPEAAFSPQSLASDVLAAVASLVPSGRGVVLVGHSMGGRVAMRCAAMDCASETPLLRSVVIEDMDLAERGEKFLPRLEAKEEAALAAFGNPDGRRFDTWEAARAALLPWYDDEARVDGWRGKRVRELPDGAWWSDINPLAQRLAAQHVLMSMDGASAWEELRAHMERCEAGEAVGEAPAIHVWYADTPGTVVTLDGPGGIDEMRSKLPQASFRFFADSGHSIHNDRVAKPAFLAALRDVVDEAAKRDASRAGRVRGPRGG